jgi:hypothetical protein
VSQFVPGLIHRACEHRGFDCLETRVRYPSFQMLAFGSVGNDEAGWERRQEQNGLGAEAAAGECTMWPL